MMVRVGYIRTDQSLCSPERLTGLNVWQSVSIKHRGNTMRVSSLGLSTGLLTLIAPFMLAAPAAADAPTQVSDSVTFVDVNPCTGLNHTVTIAVTGFEHSHDGRLVYRESRTITTQPTGFVGHGTVSIVDNGQIFRGSLTDILKNPDGDRIRVRFVIVTDLSSGTVRVEKGGMTCLGPA
jgi:hypothetical protein